MLKLQQRYDLAMKTTLLPTAFFAVGCNFILCNATEKYFPLKREIIYFIIMIASKRKCVSLPRSEKMCGMQHDKMKLLSCAFMPFSS